MKFITNSSLQMESTKSKHKSTSTKPRPFIRDLDVFNNGFWMTPRLIAERQDITYLEKFIISILLGLHMDKTRYELKDGVTPGQQWIADQLGTYKQAISRSIKRLEKLNIVTNERRGLTLTNVYKISIGINP